MAVVAQRGAAPSDFLETEPFLGSDYKTADIVSIFERERERERELSVSESTV